MVWHDEMDEQVGCDGELGAPAYSTRRPASEKAAVDLASSIQY